jgi:hypothetical protein
MSHAKLIAALFPDDPVSQRMAANFVALYGDAPGASERIEPILREAAAAHQRVASGEITPETGRAQLGGFAEVIGIPAHLVGDGMAFLEAGAGLTAEELAAAEAPAGESAQEPQAPAPSALAGRDALRREIEQHEKNMRAPEGSAEWKAYWRDGGADAYRAALDRLQAGAEAPEGSARGAPAASASDQPGPAAPIAPPAA